MKEKDIALVIFVDEYNRVLLQQRHSISRYGEKWGFFGGKVEEGETIEEALEREAFEELDYILKEYIPFKTYIWNPHPNLRATEYFFIAKMPPLQELNIKEGNGMLLCTIEKAKELEFMKNHYKTLDDLEAYLKNPENQIENRNFVENKE